MECLTGTNLKSFELNTLCMKIYITKQLEKFTLMMNQTSQSQNKSGNNLPNGNQRDKIFVVTFSQQVETPNMVTNNFAEIQVR